MRHPVVIRFFAFFAITVLFSYCKKPTEFKEIEVNNLFTLQVPVYLHPTGDLMPDNIPNIHQYDDSIGNVCLLIFDTSRVGFEISTLKTFYDSMVANPVMDSARILAPELVKIDNDSAYQSEITGKHSNVRLFGELAAIASKNRFYFILTWSSLDRRDILKQDMYKILHSFHDISHLKK
jgi:hypothetical protein